MERSVKCEIAVLTSFKFVCVVCVQVSVGAGACVCMCVWRHWSMSGDFSPYRSLFTLYFETGSLSLKPGEPNSALPAYTASILQTELSPALILAIG